MEHKMQKYFQYLEVEVIFIKLTESEQMKMISVPSFAGVTAILAIDSCSKFDLVQRIPWKVKEKVSKLNNENTDDKYF